MGKSSPRLRTARISDRPSSPGSITSMIATSGGSATAVANPPRPSSATIVVNPSSAKAFFRNSAVFASSSTINARIATSPLGLWRGFA